MAQQNMNNTRIERKSNKVFFGVAAGLADYFGLDVTVVRLILIVLALLDGSGVVLTTYLVAIWIMPKAWDYPGRGEHISPKSKSFRPPDLQTDPPLPGERNNRSPFFLCQTCWVSFFCDSLNRL